MDFSGTETSWMCSTTHIDGRAAVVVEYLEGIDLNSSTRAAKDGKVLPVGCALEVAAAVASALDAAYNRPPMPGEKPLGSSIATSSRAT